MRPACSNNVRFDRGGGGVGEEHLISVFNEYISAGSKHE